MRLYADRADYLDGLRAVLPTGGRYFVLGFRGPQTDNPARHLTREDITACFTRGRRIDAIEETTLDSRSDPDGIPGRLVALTRT